MEAHEQLEELILDRETLETKKKLGSQLAQVVYEGKWFTPLREAIQAFVESTQKYVTGEVKFKLYKGNIIKAGTTSPYSIYDEDIASFSKVLEDKLCEKREYSIRQICARKSISSREKI